MITCILPYMILELKLKYGEKPRLSFFISGAGSRNTVAGSRDTENRKKNA